MTFGELKRHGTFGLGTFDVLDGEMIGLEGRFYQIKANGVAYPVPNSMTTPFAVVTVFDADKTFPEQDGMDYEGLKTILMRRSLIKASFMPLRSTARLHTSRLAVCQNNRSPITLWSRS